MKRAITQIFTLLLLITLAVPAFAGKVLAELEYFYSDDGTLTGKTFNGNRVNFEYDLRGQLLAVKDAQGKDLERYTYDPAGNRLSKTINGVTTTYTYDKANQLVTSTVNGVTTHYKYDAAGRMIQAGDKKYIYNGQNKVAEVRQNGKTIARFEYNIDGQIAKAIYGDKVEEFIWDGLALIWRSGVTYINEPYVTGGNPVMAGDDVLFNDMLGSTLAVNGNPVEMTSFGETTDKNAFFTGKPMVDELGFAFLFRDYNPNQGKWTTTDPLGYPDGWNNLAYCNNKTIETFDYAGLSSLGYYYYVAGYYYYTANDLFAPGVPQTSINSFQDALNHYRSGKGGTVAAGPGLIAEMKADKTFASMLQNLSQRISEKLLTAKTNETSGTVSNSPGAYRGLEAYPTLGSYRLDIEYNANWTATKWEKESDGRYSRLVSSSFTVYFSGENAWDFKWNENYNFIQNVTQELLAGYIAGSVGKPKDFIITYSTTHNFSLQVKQYE